MDLLTNVIPIPKTFSQQCDGRRSSSKSSSSHGPETFAFPEEKHGFPGLAMMGARKRDTDRRVVEKNVLGIGITFVNKSISSATLRNSGKTQSVEHLALQASFSLRTVVRNSTSSLSTTTRRHRRVVFLFRVPIIAWPGNQCFSLGKA